jgi:uncharacterized Zn finger protein
MSKRWNNYPAYEQPTADELRQKAEASMEKAVQSGQTYEPVHVEGRKLCSRWWGIAWCENLERYADYASRLSRGKRYVRAGAVLDLKVRTGLILAQVQGSRRHPYQVKIHIDPLTEKAAEKIRQQCIQKIKSLEELATGEFPKELQNIFTGTDGLFPKPSDIHFDCSCPDWADMCKHVAAAMYAVGVRLDENPFYFFKLRGINADEFIAAAIDDRIESMLKHATDKSSRIIDEKDVHDLFGVL